MMDQKRSNSATALGRRLNSTSRTDQHNVNYGHLLYERGVKRANEKKSAFQRARSDRDEHELDGFTFHPEINQVSKGMKRVNGEKPEDFLLKYGKAVKEK